uniref:Uncharacterized protein n=1 Tax=Aegilops tauschii subsp. strangulata TaxID=200361 RepID=A0A453PP17_AEGTS
HTHTYVRPCVPVMVLALALGCCRYLLSLGCLRRSRWRGGGVAGVVVGGIDRRGRLPGGRRRAVGRPEQAAEDGGRGSAAVPGHGERGPAVPSSELLGFQQRRGSPPP